MKRVLLEFELGYELGLELGLELGRGLELELGRGLGLELVLVLVGRPVEEEEIVFLKVR